MKCRGDHEVCVKDLYFLIGFLTTYKINRVVILIVIKQIVIAVEENVERN